MVIYREFKGLKSLAAPVHWAMGMFDGVHLGHAGVIAAAVKGAALDGATDLCRKNPRRADIPHSSAGPGEAGKRAARHHGGRC